MERNEDAENDPVDKMSSQQAANSLRHILENLNTTDDLEVQLQDIKTFLELGALKSDSNMFMDFIEMGASLLSSHHFLPVIKQMAALFIDVQNMTVKGPVDAFLKLIDDETIKKYILSDESVLLPLIQVLYDAEKDCEARSEILRALILHSQHVSTENNAIKWTEDYIGTLKHLLQHGADPTWMPLNFGTEKRERFAAQYKFFYVTKYILIQQNHLWAAIKDILPYFLSTTSVDYENTPGTPLHAFICDSSKLWCKPNLSFHFFVQ